MPPTAPRSIQAGQSGQGSTVLKEGTGETSQQCISFIIIIIIIIINLNVQRGIQGKCSGDFSMAVHTVFPKGLLTFECVHGRRKDAEIFP